MPNHRNRTADEISSKDVHHDSTGYFFRSASWIDYVKRTGNFAAFYYACIDARLAIEHLIFEQLVISAGESLNFDNYKRCVSNPRKLDKLIQELVPDYEKLQEFAEIVCSLQSKRTLNRWNVKDLRKYWGQISRYLHWMGAKDETNGSQQWRDCAIQEVASIVEKLWEKSKSGYSGSIRIDTMPPKVHDIWGEFRDGVINVESVRIRLQIVE